MIVRTQVKISKEDQFILDDASAIIHSLADVLYEKGLENHDFSGEYLEELYTGINFVRNSFGSEGIIFNESEE